MAGDRHYKNLRRPHQHPDRDAQFKYISKRIKARHRLRSQPLYLIDILSSPKSATVFKIFILNVTICVNSENKDLLS